MGVASSGMFAGMPRLLVSADSGCLSVTRYSMRSVNSWRDIPDCNPSGMSDPGPHRPDFHPRGRSHPGVPRLLLVAARGDAPVRAVGAHQIERVRRCLLED